MKSVYPKSEQLPIIYDFKDEFLTEMFRWKCKEAGDFIKRHIKGWMLPARERAARQGMWSGLGSTPIGYVVDMNPASTTYKRFVSYEPHATIVRYLFQRFMELSGNLWLLIRELSQHPVIFPRPELTEQQYIQNGLLSQSGGVLRTRSALESILTNRTYLGWRIVKSQIATKTSHEAIVDINLFTYAFEKLTGCDLEGNPLPHQEHRKRFFKTNPENMALVKNRVTSETGHVYAKIVLERRSRKYTYVPAKAGHSFWRHGMVEMLPIEKLDQIVVDRLFYHIKSIKDLPDYDAILQQKKAERQQAPTHITQSLKSLLEQQDRLIKQMQKTAQESVRDILLQQIEELETEKNTL